MEEVMEYELTNTGGVMGVDYSNISISEEEFTSFVNRYINLNGYEWLELWSDGTTVIITADK